MRWLMAGVAGFAVLFAGILPARAALKPEQVPLFSLRARVVSAGGKEAGDSQFMFRIGKGSAAVVGPAWSAWMAFDRAEAEANEANAIIGRASCSASAVPLKCSGCETEFERRTHQRGLVRVDNIAHTCG